ncbi:MAG: AAA family ATPase [Actinomycetota bacterium]|jgi:hypothetical protein
MDLNNLLATDTQKKDPAFWAEYLKLAKDMESEALRNMGREEIKERSMPSYITEAELATFDFPPIKWVVPDLIPQGLTILAGKPKVGKSWMVLDIARQVASGGEFLGRSIDQGAVLYLALEDTQRRLQERLGMIRQEGDAPSPHLTLSTTFPRFPDARGRLLEWLESAENPRLIIVDTLGHIRMERSGKEAKDAYQIAYEDLTELKAIADEMGIGVLAITHTRKAGAESSGDPLDAVVGSVGQAGTADTIMVLDKQSGPGAAKLLGRGRDITEFSFKLQFSDETSRWGLAQALDSKSALESAIWLHATSDEFKGADLLPMCPEGTTVAALRKALSRMKGEGLLIGTRRGHYRKANVATSECDVTDVTSPIEGSSLTFGTH